MNTLVTIPNEMGSVGNLPAPVGNLPTGIAESNFKETPFSRGRAVLAVPSGRLPDSTGRLPVLPTSATSSFTNVCAGAQQFFRFKAD